MRRSEVSPRHASWNWKRCSMTKGPEALMTLQLGTVPGVLVSSKTLVSDMGQCVPRVNLLTGAARTEQYPEHGFNRKLTKGKSYARAGWMRFNRSSSAFSTVGYIAKSLVT